MSEPRYIPYADRGHLSPEERADSDQHDRESGEQARRIRETDRIEKAYIAAQKAKQ